MNSHYELVHCTTQLEPRGVSDIGFSLCAAPDYLLLMSEYFRCILEVLRMSGSVQKSSGSSEVNLGLSVVQRDECRGQSKARALEVIGLFPEVQKLRVRCLGVKIRSSRQ